jgi:hypothetical protein
MTKPYFRSTPEQVPRRGATSSKAGLDVPRRVAALEQGAGPKLAPSVYCAAMYLANSGAPTHTSSGNWQKVADGGGTDTWTAEYDYRPTGITAQVDTATNKRIDIQRSWLYLVTASIRFSAITSGRVGCQVYVSGAGGPLDLRDNGAAANITASVSTPISLAAGAYLELYAYQEESASEAYHVSSAYGCRLTATLIGPPA